MGRAGRTQRAPSAAAPTAPCATPVFVGREAELLRILEHLDGEVLFTIYGVAGIGKSELAYRVLERARERPGWEDATPTLVQVQQGMDEQHLVAILRLRSGADRVRADRLGGPARSLAEELEPVVLALNAARRLLLLDDVHLVDPEAAARVLGHLARRVRRSRIFAASRLEIPFPAGTLPVVTRLAPLDDHDAQRMLALLGRRLGVELPDVRGIVRRAGGSPFFLQREIVASPSSSAEPAGDRLEGTLRQLPAAARRLLVRAAVLSDRVAVAELRASGGAPIDAPLATLARHFFVELGDGTVAVHELVRGAALRLAPALEIARAHRAAARLLVARGAAGGPEGALAVVEAVRHLCAAGEHRAALALIAERYGVVSGAGLDHLLIGSLEELRAAAPDAQVELVLARILLRRSHVAEAHQLLARLEADPAIADSVRYLTLAGTIASQRGELRTAELCLSRARDAVDPAAGGAERVRIALHLADVLALRGESGRARAVLDDVRPLCDRAGGRTLLRWGWSAGLSWVLEKEFARTITTVAPFRERAVREGASDLAAQLTMLEVLARAELHDAAGARELTASIVAPAARAGALRAPLASFYLGVAAWADGDLPAAAIALRDTWTFLNAHHHGVLGPIVGHYLARVQLALGDARGAAELFDETTRRAAELGLSSVTDMGSLGHARALLRAGDVAGAARVAEAALAATPASGSFQRTFGHRTLALAAAVAGDLAAARRHLAAARAVAADEPQRVDIALETAEVELCGGDAAASAHAAGVARAHYAARGLHFLEARACVALAGANTALGGPGDLIVAEEALAHAAELGARYGYDRVLGRVVLVRAAIKARRGDRGAAERLLAAHLAVAGPATTVGQERELMRLALGSALDHELAPGLAAQLVLLGLRGAAVARHEVVVQLTQATISSRHAAVKGRPVSCALLASLIDGGGRPVPADVLYRAVWGAREYHPLRHRNTLYVALNRLRQALATLCPGPGGETIETLPAGWRLAERIVARKA